MKFFKTNLGTRALKSLSEDLSAMRSSRSDQFNLADVHTTKVGRPAKSQWARVAVIVAAAVAVLSAAQSFPALQSAAKSISLYEMQLISSLASSLHIFADQTQQARPVDLDTYGGPQTSAYSPPYQDPFLTQLEVAHPRGIEVESDVGLDFQDVDPNDVPSENSDPEMMDAVHSTLMLAVFNGHGSFTGFGSGTVLKNTMINGHPAILTALHMFSERLAGDSKSIIVAFIPTKNGPQYVEVLKPGKLNAKPNRDAPILGGVDLNYPVNKEILAKIPGVEIAHTLSDSPAAIEFGGSMGPIGVTSGNSGGGVYVKENGHYRIVGVISSSGPGANSSLVPVKSETTLPHQLVENGAKYGECAVVPSNSITFISNLGENNFQSELASVATKPTVYQISNEFDHSNVFTVGFGMGISAVVFGAKTSNHIIADLAPKLEEASFMNAIQEEKKSLTEDAKSQASLKGSKKPTDLSSVMPRGMSSSN